MPYFPRMGRPGLIGLAARTTVVAGTATAVSGGIMAHRQHKAIAEAEAAQYEAIQQQITPPVSAVQSTASTEVPVDLAAALQRLGDLRTQGLLDDAEFAAAKKRLLA